MSKDNFFENEPPKHLDERILNAAGKALAENRRIQRRKMVFAWIAIPAGALAGFAMFFKVIQQTRESRKQNLITNIDDMQAAEFIEWNEIDGEEQDMVADLEILEELDILEKWDNT